MKIKKLRLCGEYLETFCSTDDTWAVYLLDGTKYCFSHTTVAFDFAGNEEACIYSEVVQERSFQ